MLLWAERPMDFDAETGDVVNDAIYSRTRTVEESCNVSFDIVEKDGAVSGYPTWIKTLDSSVLAGDDAYQLAGGYAYRLSYDSLNGNYVNLMSVPAIDFTREWWPTDLYESASFGGKMYIANGYLDLQYVRCVYGIYFNKTLAENYGVGDLYTLVRDGGWTLDRLTEYSALAAVDIDGDSKMTKTDGFGFVSGKYMQSDAYIHAFEIKCTDFDADGTPYIVGLTEKLETVKNTLQDFLYSDSVWRSDDANETNGLFMEDRALFDAEYIGQAESLRAMESDFGILPYPKWNDEQENYNNCNAVGNTTGFVIPVTADADRSGTLLTALEYEGYKQILPAFYDIALKGKYSRDANSEEMLDLICRSVTFDFMEIYSFAFGDGASPYMQLRDTINGKTDIASAFAKNESKRAEAFGNLIGLLK